MTSPTIPSESTLKMPTNYARFTAPDTGAPLAIRTPAVLSIEGVKMMSRDGQREIDCTQLLIGAMYATGGAVEITYIYVAEPIDAVIAALHWT